MSQIKRHLERLLDPADPGSKELLATMDSALALEAMRSFLQNVPASQLGQAGLMMANIAIEAYSNVPALRAKGLAFSLEGLEGDPDAVVQNGIKAVQEQIEAAWGGIDAELTRLMVAQVAKMARYKDRAKALRAAVEEVTTWAQGADPQAVAASSYLMPTRDMFRLATSEGFADCAKNVAPAIEGLLKAHGGAWMRQIKVLVEWLKEHQAQLLANQDVFKSLEFSGKDLMMLNATFKGEPRDGEELFVSEELPGGYKLLTVLPYSAGHGLGAIDAMRTVFMSVEEQVPVKNASTFNTLTVNELRTLTQQLQNLLPALSEWYGNIYDSTWSNPEYSEILCRAVIRGLQEPGVGAREFKNYAITVFHLMTVATHSVDDYAFDTLEALVAYAKASIAQYQ